MPGAVITSEQGVRSPCRAQMLITSSLHCQHPELKWSVGQLLLHTAVGAPSMNLRKSRGSLPNKTICFFSNKTINLIDDIGTFPYGTRLAELDLTTLAERRVRGDLGLIENNVVDYEHDIFVLGRSGRNIVSCGLKVSGHLTISLPLSVDCTPARRLSLPWPLASRSRNAGAGARTYADQPFL